AQRAVALERDQLAVLADDRRSADLQMQVGAFALDQQLERFVDLEHPDLYRPGCPHSLALDQVTSRSFCASPNCCSFFSDWFSIWRIRSRVTLKVRPTSSSVRGCSPPSP